MTLSRFAWMQWIGLVFAAPALAADPPVVLPGGELDFALADEFLLKDSPPSPGVESAVVNTGTLLGSHLLAYAPLARGSCEVGRDNVFQLEGDYFQSVLPARVCGRVDVNGFVTLVGMGQVRVDLLVEVIDRGDDPGAADDRLIHSHSLLSRCVVQELAPSASIGVTVDAGSATLVQGGVGLGAGVSIPLRTEVVRESLAFGFDVPLRRGRSYVVRVRCVTAAKLGLVGGLAGASFFSAVNVPQNLLSPDTWLSSLHLPIKNLTIPDVSSDAIGITKLFEFPKLTVPEGVPVFGGYTIFNGVSVPVPKSFISTHDVLGKLGIPANVLDIAASKLLGVGVAFLKEEGILGAGVRVLDLAVQVQDDRREQEMRLLMHDNLTRSHRHDAIAEFQLPQAHGGYLELVREVVGDVILRMAAAGEDVSLAGAALQSGDQKHQVGDFKAAYGCYRQAYSYATR